MSDDGELCMVGKEHIVGSYSRGGRNDQGYATVLGVSIILAVISLVLLLISMGAREISQSILQVRADFIALALAQEEALSGQGCEKAQEYVQINAVTLQSCRREEPRNGEVSGRREELGGSNNTGQRPDWMIVVEVKKNFYSAEAHAGPVVGSSV